MIVNVLTTLLIAVNGWFFGYGAVSFYYDHRRSTSARPTDE